MSCCAGQLMHALQDRPAASHTWLLVRPPGQVQVRCVPGAQALPPVPAQPAPKSRAAAAITILQRFLVEQSRDMSHLVST